MGTETKRKSRRWWWAGSAFALVVVAGVVAVRASSGGSAEGEVVAVTKRTLELAVVEVGTLEPLRKIEVKSKVAGQVAEVLVDVGAKVKEGDVLMRLIPIDAERAVREVEARMKVSAAGLTQARAELGMKKRAHGTGAASDLELSMAEGQVARHEAEGQVLQVELQRARDTLGYTQIRAPIDGTVLARNVEPGEMVTPGVASMVDGKPLLVVAQTQALLVRTELNQLDVAKVRLEQTGEVTLDALPGQKFSGRVFRVAAMAQKSERRKDSSLLVFPVDVLVPMDQPGAEALKPGMLAEVRIPVTAKSDVLAVPVEAIVREKGATRLLKVGEGEDLPIDVVVGLQNDTHAEIVSGIAMGDKVRLAPAEITKD